jgi:colanic acid/amylovoran biosynthesis glycosyltransferase
MNRLEHSGSLNSDPAVALRPVVVHSVHAFLEVSENWIYSQVAALTRYQSHIVTDCLRNHEQFPAPESRLHLAPPVIRGKSLIERIIRRIGLRRNYSYSAGFCAQVRNCQPRILHSHFGNRGYDDISLARKLRLPHVVTFYGHDLSLLPRNPLWQQCFSRLFREAALFTVEGPHMKDSLAALGCPQGKIRVRRHGVDLRTFPFVARAPCDDGTIKILVAGRFVEKKGIPYALQAVAHVARENPALRLTLVGDSYDDLAGKRLKREILSLLEQEPLRHRSEWLGSVSVARFMEIAKEHHIFIQASMHSADGDCEGGAPVVLNQLTATGMPIIATRHCDIPEIVLDGKTGFLVEERDVLGLADRLRRVVSAPESWPRLGIMARAHAERTFELSKTIADLEDIYDEALSCA